MTKGGERRWIDARLSTIDLDGTPTLVGTVVDVTDNKLASEALRESEQKFRTLADNSYAIIVLMQEQGAIYVNPELARITEYSREELLAIKLWDLLHPDEVEKVRRYRRQRLDGEGPPQRHETRIRTKAGRTRWIDVSASAFRLDDRPTTLVTAVDITDRKVVEEELRSSETRLRTLLDHYNTASR